MKNEQEKKSKEKRPVGLCFDEGLQMAIQSGNGPLIKAALGRQESNEITEDVSNHLLLRSFLANQKSKLVALERNYADEATKTIDDFYQHLNKYLDELKTQFEAVFISGETEYPYTKLTGDTLFRKALGEQNEYLPLLARAIAEIDKNDLLSPAEILELAEIVTEEIYKNLQDALVSLEEEGINTSSRSALQKQLAFQINEIDALLLNKDPEDTKTR